MNLKDTYDAKCADLARHFLQDEPEINDHKHMVALAITIQRAVEDFFECELERKTP